jgi:hypothetical protein
MSSTSTALRKMKSGEWSCWDQRHRRQNREGSDEGVWKRPSFKSDKILVVVLWIFAGAAAVPHIHKLSG